jgi:sugar/nucleoside kinase (ribokinase family)
MSITTVGTVAFDAIETPFGQTDKIVGGAATYIAWAASYFSNDINLVSVIGEDFPQEEIDKLNQRGVDTEGLEVKKGEKSFYWKGKYHMDMNTRDSLATELNVLADFDPKIPSKYHDCDFLMLGNLTPQVQTQVIDSFSTRPKLVAMDTMNFWMESEMEALKHTISKVDLMIINDEEARQLSQEYSLVKAARQIMDMGPGYLVIKKGEHGALLFHGNEVFFGPALPLEEVFDPTGAGDTFAGGFMGYLASTKDMSFESMKRAVIYGSAMASFCVEKFGTQRLQELTQEELDNRIQEFINLVQFDIELEKA